MSRPRGHLTVRGVVAGLAVLCVMATGPMLVVGHAGQAKPAAANAAAKALKNPVAANAASIEAGKVVFAKYCRSCHGPEGKGDGPGTPKDVKPANLTDAKWDHGSTDGEIFTTIKMGVPPKLDMDAYDGRIKDPDIWNLVNYIKTLGPAKK
jgi:mono/diheme cytochrome c family protein